MDSIDKTTLVYLLCTCVTIILALISYIFDRQSKDIKENRLMLEQISIVAQKQELKIQRHKEEHKLLESKLLSIKALFNKQFDSIVSSIPREIELAVVKNIIK